MSSVPNWRSAAALAAVLALTGCGGNATKAAPGGAKPIAHHHAGPADVPRSVPVLTPPPGAPARSVHVPVLTYHRVVDVSAVGQLDLKVDPANFAAEMDALSSAGFHSISQAQLFSALYKGASLPTKPVIISFDDGYVDDVRTILPILKRHGMIGWFFVITGRMTEPGFLTAAQIRELDRAGMDVGDHSAHHVDLRALTPSELTSETLGSRRVLQRVLEHFVYTFAYPFGYFNATVLDALRRAGYTMAFTTQGGTTESTDAPLTMPRIHVGRSETPSGLVSLLLGR